MQTNQTNNQSSCTPPLLYTMPEVAQILHTNIGYAHDLRKAGLLHCMKLGSYKVRRSELIRFLKDCEGKDVSDPYNVRDIQ